MGLPRQLHGPKKEFLGGCKGSEQQLVAQGHAPSPSPPLPKAFHLGNNAAPKARAQCDPHVGSLGPRLSIYGTGTGEGFGVGNLEPACFREMGKWSGLPAHFLSVCSSPHLELQPDWFLKLVIFFFFHLKKIFLKIFSNFIFFSIYFY